ncbi:exosome component 10 [Neoarius graeffei]|uniref:exosome component 10 n=1 Tax=Neoarius graeffei TaxID=443677 RepID=UPI00298D3FEE|nr:exosome component 10 [Neoarius graeffei]XP_060787511.1 exosome component 10 [Neoarius graeffei]XP_060787512.1 exosome component 10 [Neoarius graeffei]
MDAYTSDGVAAGAEESKKSTKNGTNSEAEEFCPGFKDVDAFVKYGLGSVMAATKASASLPQAGDEHDFYRSFPAFQDFCSVQGDRLLHCMSQLMQHHGCRSRLRDQSKLTGLEERFDMVVDSNDVILEKVGILLDEASGVTRSEPVMPAGYQPPKIIVSSWNRKGGDRSTGTFHLLHAKNIQRPQLKFKEKVDNSNTPFISKIFVKPNALKPLAPYFSNKHLRKERPEDLDVPIALADFIHQMRTQEHMEDMFSHPYQFELDHTVMLESLKSKPQPQMYKDLAETTCQFISSLDDLVALNEKLNAVTEFAVDLEHHSYRSFLGITCLMQISTRDEDFIIDTLELRSEMYILNESFTNPNIVKVFHGADSDIEWLQKDFGLYVVNMFDTHQASRLLNLGRNSLDNLLKVFCGVDSNKHYQLADWRIRPLPEEMIKYAQADTHYLLYVYDRLRADLFDAANGQPVLIQLVWSRSKDLCLKKYMKPIFTEESYMELYKRQKKSFNSQQLTAFRLMYAWRDKLAREEDESIGYILPNHMLTKIAEELPKEPQGIIACCNPVPPLVRQQVNELHQFIRQAREIPLLKAELLAEKKKLLMPRRKSELTLFGPHDTSRVSECDLVNLSSQETPTKRGDLFSEEDDANLNDDLKSLNGLVTCPKISLFAEEEEASKFAHITVAQQKARSIMESFENPFRMYLPSKDIHINKNAKYDPSSKIYEISNRWKLQSIEQQQKEARAKQQAKEQAKKAKEERKKAKQSYQESLQDVTTVRQQVLEAKQAGQKRERVPSEEGEETRKLKKKASKTDKSTTATSKASQQQESEDPEQAPSASFTPYDYSQSNFKLFAGKPKDSTQFDPNRQANEPRRKKNPKGNKQRTAQGRSMSYLPAKSDRGFRHNWPKR